MNENTTQLIEQLAQKLGTTTEYLWSILIKQAPISAITNLVLFGITIVVGLILFKAHIYFSTEKEDSNGYSRSLYDKHEEALGVPMVFFAVTWVVMFILVLCSIEQVINGFFNPEYWALDRVLDTVSH